MSLYPCRRVSSMGLTALALLATLVLPLTVPGPLRAQGNITAIHLVPGILGQAFPRSTSHLVLHVPVTNRGAAPGLNVVVSSATAGIETPIAPTNLPIALGVIAPGGAADLALDFDRTAFPTGLATTLTVKGTYTESSSTRGFQMSIPLTVLEAGTPDGTTESQSATRAPDLPGPTQGADGFYPHDPTSMVLPPDNEVPDVPIGPTRDTPIVPPSDININLDTGGGGFTALSVIRPLAATDPLRFNTDRNFNGDIPPPPGFADAFGAKSSGVLDPTVARNMGDMVLVSGNFYLGVSLNAGGAFIPLDPTTIFAPYPGGRRLAGDQVVHYAPTIDRFVYVGISRRLDVANAINELRIAVASPAAIQADLTAMPRRNTAWQNGGTYTLDTPFLNIPNMSLDFPDIAVSQEYLSVSGNIFQMVAAAGGGLENQYRGYYVLSVRLANLQNPPAGGPTFYLLFFNDSATDGVSGRLTQDASMPPHIAAHINSSTLRVGEWDTLTKVWTLRNVGNASYTNETAAYTVCGNGATQWLSMVGEDITGATERFPVGSNGELWFAWTAGRDADYTLPHIRIARIDQKAWTLLENKIIANPDLCWGYPSLASNTNAEVGMAAMVSGANGIPNFGVSLLTGAYANGTDAGAAATKPRWGDYMTIRRDPKNPKLFSATGYGVAANPATYRLWYSRFGRSTDVIAGP
jgi:hypothetical protein